uniref:Uncharacterized protein n=1 Tax=Moniliophthora roreri TaxID=221103 RepID=A0A0W0FCX7_MONRR
MEHPFSIWNSHSASSFDYDLPPPSLFGALPVTSARIDAPSFKTTKSSNVTLTFSSYDVLNCVISGINTSHCFYAVTDPSMPTYTCLKTQNGQNNALVEWSPDGVKVEIRGAVPKQPASQFLKLSGDNRFRVMKVGLQEFIWLSGHGQLSLYTAGTGVNNTTCVARITNNGGPIMLDISKHAVSQPGLLLPDFYRSYYITS